MILGHNERVGAIIFHPRATLDLDTSAPCMVSCASDGSVLLWDLERYGFFILEPFVIIFHRIKINLEVLVTEIYRTRANLNPSFMGEIFVEREVHCN